MESRNNYTTVNSKTWDVWSEHGCEWSIPVTHEDFERAKAGSWGVFLTPCKTVPKRLVPTFCRDENSGPCQRRRTADAYLCRTGRGRDGVG